MEFKNAPKSVNEEEGKRQQEYLNQLKELIAEKIQALIAADLSFEDICKTNF